MLTRIRTALDEREQGFTLIELLVVIIIIGILAAIAIPVFLNQRKKAAGAQAKSDARHLATLQETYFTDNQKYQVSTDLASTKAALPDYRASRNVTSVVMKDYQADGVTLVGTQDVGGFCITATDDEGESFVYDSLHGGLQPAGAPPC